jgi:type IV secretion system protein VirB9
MKKLLMLLTLLGIGSASIPAQAANPIATDSRIRTFVYNENEVFPVTTHFGYQSYISFAKGEEIQVISLGDAFPWQVTPMDNRLFIKPIDAYSHTNMTVVTDKHTYQFDLQSKLPPKEIDADLTYVVRFYYPDNSFDRVRLEGGEGNIEAPSLEMPMTQGKQYNFNYTMVGPDGIAPVKVFDDGQTTYFQFPNSNAVIPTLSSLDQSGEERPLETRPYGQFVAVDGVVSRYTARLGQDLVCIFNEGGGA